MAPSPPSSRLKLSYPLYDADFDPQNLDFLLVGGGGGTSSTGVPNKLSLIDCSHARAGKLKEVVDVELSKTEDSVSSLAVAQSTETSLTAYAGINSSTEDQARGRNEHLRSFKIDLPRKRKAAEGPSEEEEKDAVAGTTEALGRAQFFRTQSGSKNETYQRIVRLSSSGKDASQPRITAIASGLASESEIVLLKAGLAPGSGNEIARLSLGNKEAVDLDFAPINEENGMEYTMAYCSEYDVSLYRLSGGKDSIKTQTRMLYSTPEASGDAKRPKFRALRFLSSKHILLLQNLPDRKGVELLILRQHKDGTSAVISLQKRLSKGMKMATGLDVCILSASPTGDRQVLIAVSGQNNSIEVLWLDYSKEAGMSSFFPYTILKDIHNGPITGLVFSTFVPPTVPVSKSPSVNLASVSVDQNVVVHKFALRPLPAKSTRYVLVSPGNTNLISDIFSIFMAILVIALAALCLQVFSEVRGVVPPVLGSSEWLPSNLKDMIRKPNFFQHGNPVVPAVSQVEEAASLKASDVSDLLKENDFYTELLADATDAVKSVPSSVSSSATALTDLVAEATQGSEQKKAVVVIDTGDGDELSTELHHEEAVADKETLRKWEDLHEHEKVSWRKKLADAGHWVEGQGEGVLKGILFSELAGFAAQAAGG